MRPYANNPRVLRNAAEKVAESIAGHSRLAAALSWRRSPHRLRPRLRPSRPHQIQRRLTLPSPARMSCCRTPPPRRLRQWAANLRDRELRGERLGVAQRRCWRAALGYPEDEPIERVADDLRARGVLA